MLFFCVLTSVVAFGGLLLLVCVCLSGCPYVVIGFSGNISGFMFLFAVFPAYLTAAEMFNRPERTIQET